jgi:hypothetical protein
VERGRAPYVLALGADPVLSGTLSDGHSSIKLKPFDARAEIVSLLPLSFTLPTAAIPRLRSFASAGRLALTAKIRREYPWRKADVAIVLQR